MRRTEQTLLISLRTNFRILLVSTRMCLRIFLQVSKRVDVLREIQRYEIVNGVFEVGGSTTDAEETKYADKAEKGVPNFWLIAMKNNEVLAEEISERDEGALKFLQDIKWSRVDNPKGFKLEFYFDTNPFFKNTVLTKTYHMIDEDEPILEKAIGTEIDWYPGKCLTQKILKKKPKKGSKMPSQLLKLISVKVSSTSLVHHKYPRRMKILLKMLLRNSKI